MDSNQYDPPPVVVNLDDHRGSKPHSNRLSVLFVEDDEVDAELVDMALRKSAVFDIVVTKARNIAEARTFLSDRPFDLMLLDYWLGPDTGLSILEELGGRRGRIPVVLLTGYSNQDIQQLGHRAGAFGFLSKDDVSANTLDAVIRSTLSSHEAESELYATLTERDRALRTKLEVFGRLSGRIDQPLQQIADAAALVSKLANAEGLNARFADNVQIIQSNTKLVHELVHELIRQAQAGQYLPDLTFTSVDIGELIGKALRLMGAQLADRGQTAELHLPDRPVVARIDQTAMLQALLNVLSNASKFSARGATIKLRAVQEGDSAMMSISDEGIGMNKTQAKTALEPFGKDRLSPTFAQEGTGLGLLIALSIVERHGGRMELDSEPGLGTEIKLIFPLVR